MFGAFALGPRYDAAIGGPDISLSLKNASRFLMDG
jgi:hypothetical protein